MVYIDIGEDRRGGCRNRVECREPTRPSFKQSRLQQRHRAAHNRELVPLRDQSEEADSIAQPLPRNAFLEAIKVARRTKIIRVARAQNVNVAESRVSK